jgi:hypothetical protein
VTTVPSAPVTTVPGPQRRLFGQPLVIQDSGATLVVQAPTVRDLSADHSNPQLLFKVRISASPTATVAVDYGVAEWHVVTADGQDHLAIVFDPTTGQAMSGHLLARESFEGELALSAPASGVARLVYQPQDGAAGVLALHRAMTGCGLRGVVIAAAPTT